MLSFAELLEVVMVVCFGLSWPFNILKALRSKTARGTSVLFMIFIDVGYVAGIVSKIILMAIGSFSGSWIAWLAFVFYIVNALMVTCGIGLYFRNRQYDKDREKEARR